MDDKEFIKKLSALIKIGEMEMLSTLGETFSINYSKKASNPMKYSGFVGERNYTVTCASNRILDNGKCAFRVLQVLKYFKAKDYISLNKGGRYFQIDDIDSFGISFTVNANILDIVRKILLNFLCETPNVQNSITIENIGSSEVHGRLDSSNGIKVIIHIFPIHP